MTNELRTFKQCIYCSFCGTSQHDAKIIVAGLTVYICDECVQICVEVIADGQAYLYDNQPGEVHTMLTNEELDKALAESPAPRITKEYIKSRIVKKNTARFGDTGVMVALHLDNGFIASGTAACVNVENFNPEIGERIAYDNAFRQFWPLFGFMLAERQFLALNLEAAQQPTEPAAPATATQEGGVV